MSYLCVQWANVSYNTPYLRPRNRSRPPFYFLWLRRPGRFNLRFTGYMRVSRFSSYVVRIFPVIHHISQFWHKQYLGRPMRAKQNENSVSRAYHVNNDNWHGLKKCLTIVSRFVYISVVCMAGTSEIHTDRITERMCEENSFLKSIEFYTKKLRFLIFRYWLL